MKITHLSLALFTAALAGCNSPTPGTSSTPQTVDKPEPMVTLPASTAAPQTTDNAMTNMSSNSKAQATKGAAKTYRVRGQVVEVPPAKGNAFVVLKHENIPGFMPAMQMRLPLQNAADASQIKAGDKIAFDMNADNVQISNIEKLPPSTQLKLSAKP